MAHSVAVGAGSGGVASFSTSVTTYIPSLARCPIRHAHLKSFTSNSGSGSVTQSNCNWSRDYSPDCSAISFDTDASRIYTITFEYKLPVNVLIEKIFKIQVGSGS